MSRSVSYQSGAMYVKYFAAEPVYGVYNPETDQYEGEEYNAEESQWSFENDVENIKCALKKALPSLEEVPRRDQCSYTERQFWGAADRETWPILYNGSAVVYLSEYCGLVSISFAPREYMENEYYGPSRLALQEHWLRQVEERVNAAIDSCVDRLVCSGRFSNGEAVYSKVTRRSQLATVVNGEHA